MPLIYTVPLISKLSFTLRRLDQEQSRGFDFFEKILFNVFLHTFPLLPPMYSYPKKLKNITTLLRIFANESGRPVLGA